MSMDHSNCKTPLLRKLVTGVNAAPGSEAAQRWGNNNHREHAYNHGSGGSVREKARAYEQKFAAGQIHQGESPNARPQLARVESPRFAKFSGESDVLSGRRIPA